MLLFYFIFGVSFLVVGPNYLFDWKTCILSLSLVLFLGSVVKFSDSYFFVQNVIMTMFFSLFIIPRLIIYLLMPGMVSFSFGVTINNDQINIALLYILIGIIFISAGFWSGERIFRWFIRSKKLYSEPARYHLGVVLGVFLLTVIVSWFIQNILGVNVYANKNAGAHDWLIQFLLSVFNVDIIFFIACVTILLKRVFDKSTLLVGSFIVLVYLVGFLFIGSRGGGIRVNLMVSLILLCLKGNFKVSFRYASILVVILFSSYLTWPFSTQKRINIARQGYYNTIATQKRTNTVTNAHPDGILLYKDSKKIFSAIMNRMGLIDNAIIILSIDAEPQAKSKYMNMSYAGKNIANLLLPGVVFKDAEVNTSRVIPVLYRAFSDDYLKAGGYASDFYTPWGIFFLIFGWWKGWFMLLLAATGVQLTYFFMMRFGGKFRYHMGSLCLFSVSNLFFANMGMDHWISNSVTMLGTGVIALILLELGEFILDKTRLFLKQQSVP